MSVISRFRDNELFFHHSYDERPNPGNFFMHAHEWYEILYVVSGRGTFRIEGVTYNLIPGGIYITRPVETHHISIDPSVPYERMAIHFSQSTVLPFNRSGDLLRPFDLRTLGRMNFFSADTLDTEFCKKCFDRMDKSASFGRDRILSYLLPVLTEIFASYSVTKNRADVHFNSSELVDYVNHNLFEEISLDSISDHFFISKSQVNRAFRKATGSSVWDYVIIKRLLAARAAIHDGMPINVAFKASGFKDYSSFWRAYKKHFNCSPKDDA